jgi:hypothetical protein
MLYKIDGTDVQFIYIYNKLSFVGTLYSSGFVLCFIDFGFIDFH